MMNHKRAVGDRVRVPDGREGIIYLGHTVPSSWWSHITESSKSPRAVPVEAYEVLFPDGATDGFSGHELRIVERARYRPGDKVQGATVVAVVVDASGRVCVTLDNGEALP